MPQNMYMQIGSILGEATGLNLPREVANSIEVFGFRWSAQNHPSMAIDGTGLIAGRLNVEDFTFTKRVDRSSPTLFQSCCQGNLYPIAVFSAYKTGTGLFLKYEFNNVTISSVQPVSDQTGPPEDLVEKEEVQIRFAKVSIQYFPGGVVGSVQSSWDLVSNTRG